MSSSREMLTLSPQNPVQRRGFFSSLAIASLVLLLHFSFEGYDIDHYVTTRYGFGPCPTPGVGAVIKMTSEQLDQS